MTDDEKLAGEKVINALELSLTRLKSGIAAAKTAMKAKQKFKDYYKHMETYDEILNKQNNLLEEIKIAFNQEKFAELSRLALLVQSYSMFIEEDARLIYNLLLDPKQKPNKEDLQ